MPQLNGMEIYNIHTDVKDEGEVDEFLKTIAVDLLLSLNKYPDQAFRLLFDRQTAILDHWDEFNKTRKIVGIAASDAHQKTRLPRNLYGRRQTAPSRHRAQQRARSNPCRSISSRAVYCACSSVRSNPASKSSRIEMDKYNRSLRFVNTHILARSLTEPDVIDALRTGRVFVAFDMLADARLHVLRGRRRHEDGHGRRSLCARRSHAPRRLAGPLSLHPQARRRAT